MIADLDALFEKSVAIANTPRRCGIHAEEWQRRRDQIINATAQRIAYESRSSGDDLCRSTRGRGGQPVICLDVAGADGKPSAFSTCTQAAKFAGVARGCHVFRAIIRGGRAGGYRFAWAGDRQVTAAEQERGRCSGRCKFPRRAGAA